MSHKPAITAAVLGAVLYWFFAESAVHAEKASSVGPQVALGSARPTDSYNAVTERQAAALDVISMAASQRNYEVCLSALKTLDLKVERSFVLKKLVESEVDRRKDDGTESHDEADSRSKADLAFISQLVDMVDTLSAAGDKAACLAVIADFRGLCAGTQSPTETEILNKAVDQLRLIEGASPWERWGRLGRTVVTAACSFLSTYLVGTFVSEMTKATVKKAFVPEEPST